MMATTNTTARTHTPGPWAVEDRAYVISVPLSRVVRPVTGSGTSVTRGLVAVVYGHFLGEDNLLYTSEGNLALIAAAPELLRSAHAAYHALMSYAYGNAVPDLAKECAADLEAAIAKAEGRS